MTNQSTIDKLIEMRLTSMSDAFITQTNDPKMKDVPFEDRFGLLVDIEYNNRKSNSLKRLIKGAEFDQPEAYIADINYTSGRKLNRSLIERLATCEYILSIGTCSSRVPQEAARPTWPVLSEWRPANNVIRHSMFACRICSLSSTWHVPMAPTRKFRPSTPTLFSSSSMNGSL